eukprot:816360-Pelagomonas_calceolata.AAC.1
MNVQCSGLEPAGIFDWAMSNLTKCLTSVGSAMGRLKEVLSLGTQPLPEGAPVAELSQEDMEGTGLGDTGKT